jgi:hypothetical protein
MLMIIASNSSIAEAPFDLAIGVYASDVIGLLAFAVRTSFGSLHVAAVAENAESCAEGPF